jgi:uncharacterized coiled-coil protein SlyX
MVYYQQEKSIMTAQTEAKRNSPLDYESVWERLERTERIIEETDRIVKETAKQMKETDKKVGELTNRFGEVVEHMIVPNLKAKFNELGYPFEKIARDVEIVDRKNDIITEIDVFLENGDCAMVVELKTKLRTRDVDDHAKRMEKVRRHADLHTEGRPPDTRKYYGAIAGVVMSQSEKTYALKKGFYVIEPSGETFTITKPEGKGAPNAW